ncbi:MAG: metal-dependent hydrolase [Parcubacteria group bacterium]|nr:metal-dependent hydrolase [Parcubacteria group bacterium]
MIFAHAPAGFIAAYVTKKIWQRGLSQLQTRWLYFVGTLAGILPDIDTLYYYLVDSRFSHRELITHTPILYVVVCLTLYLTGYLLKKKFIQALSLVIFFATLSHLIFDSLNSGIGWLYPGTDLIFGLLGISALAEGWYGQYLLVITYSVELAIFLGAGNIILFAKYRQCGQRLIALIISAILLCSGIITLCFIKPHLFARNSNIYYGDYDRDGVANKNDDDIDGDGINNFEDQDADGDGWSNQEKVITTAESMTGVYYDWTNKSYWAFLSRFGFLSNTDVVTRSYDTAGIYLHQEMKRDYKNNPAGYITSPTDDRFSSSPQNIYTYCQHQSLLLAEKQAIELGDIAFYLGENGEVAHLALVVEIENEKAIVIDAGFSEKEVIKVEAGEVGRVQEKTIAYGRLLP